MRPWAFRLSTTLSALLLCAPAFSADPVRGYVINGIDGSAVRGAEVAFLANLDGQLSEISRQSTDAEGRFTFSGSFLSPNLSFVLVAFYQGVPHPSSELQVGAQREVVLEVYEPTTSDSEIRIAAHHLFVVVGESTVEVAHFAQIDNQGEKTYVGRGEGTARQVLEFALPPGGFNLSGNLNQVSATRFFDNRPLPPGISQVTFTLALDLHQLEEGYRHQVLYPTDRLEVFMKPSSIPVGAPFEDLGVEDIHGDQYRRLQLVGLHPGQSVLIPLPLSAPRRWMLKWAALGAVALLAILSLVFHRLRSGLASRLNPRSLRQQRQQLLQQLAQLDEAHAGRPDDPRYQAERARLRDRALAVYLLLEEQGEPT